MLTNKSLATFQLVKPTLRCISSHPQTTNRQLSTVPIHSCRLSSLASEPAKTISGPLSEIEKNVDNKNIKDFDQIPGPRTLPFIGALYKYVPFIGEYSLTHVLESDLKRYRKYGLISKETLPGMNFVRIFDPSDIAVMFRHEGQYPERLKLMGIKAWREARGLPEGLANVVGNEWQRYRGQVQKQMMRKTSASVYIPSQEPVAEELVQIISALRDQNGEVDNFLNELYKWSMEGIGVVCFDTRLGTMEMGLSPDSEAQQFIDAVGGAFTGIHKTLMLWEYYKSRPNSKTMKDLFKSQDFIWKTSKRHVENTLKKFNNNEKLLVPSDQSLLLSILSKPDLSPEQALSLLNDLFSGGVDTTAHTLAFNLVQLAANPQVQQRLQAEIDELAPRGTPLTHSTIEKMKYLKAVTKETSRTFPISSGTMRVLTQDMVFQGYKVPVGTCVFGGNAALCLQSKNFEEPDKFKPERWLRDEFGNKDGSHPFAILQFGYGPRMCIGRRFAEQEVWLGLIKLLQHFTVEYHHEPIGYVTRLVNMPDKPLRFSFIDRN